MKSLALAVAAAGISALVARAGEWELAWSDEFDYRGLPDRTKWNYEEGFIRNRESQYYTRERAENARVEGGMLVIECRKERFETGRGRVVDYTSASLTTRHRASWQYGRIEVRAKLPEGRGVWPAIWMLGSSISRVGWPACGEIDIMEFIGKEPGNIYGTVHYRRDGRHRSDQGRLETPAPHNDFHVYAIEWYPDRIDFFFGSTRYKSVTLDQAGTGDENPFRKPHYLLINFALGGDWGGPFDDALLPQKYLVDYVRVYREKGKEP